MPHLLQVEDTIWRRRTGSETHFGAASAHGGPAIAWWRGGLVDVEIAPRCIPGEAAVEDVRNEPTGMNQVVGRFEPGPHLAIPGAGLVGKHRTRRRHGLAAGAALVKRLLVASTRAERRMSAFPGTAVLL